MIRQATFPRIVTAVILGIGFGMVWGFGLGAIGSWLTTSEPTDLEELVVDADGTPYIRVRVRGDYDDLRFRTLEGASVERTNENTFIPPRLHEPYRPPRFFEYPIPWRDRIAGMNGFEKPAISWVILRDGARPGRAYFIGHEPESNQLVGYIGRKGFRTSVPPEDEQFNMGDLTFRYDLNAYATTGYVNTGGLGSRNTGAGFTEDDVLQPWLLYLCDGDAIQEINIRTRAVRLVKEFDGLVGIEVAGPVDINVGVLREPNLPESRLLIRTQTELLLYDVFTGSETSFKIPEELQTKPFAVNTVGSEQLLLHVNRGQWERGNVVELVTINSAGEVQQQENVRLVWVSNSQDSPFFALLPAVIVPTLFVWLGGIFVAAPIIQLQEWQVESFAEGIRVAWDKAWPGLVVVTIFSIILTTIVYRWQQKYSRPNTALWTTFVFLTTLPGFLAYWVMHRREPMGACQHCGANVPQDRDLCAKCAAPLPAPKLLGTEIFA